MSTALDRLRSIVREALDAGDSQKVLAKRLGVAQPTISGWLTEDTLDPRASVLEAVARVLGVNAHWLVTGEGERRAMTVGADAVFAAGVQSGLQRAEEAVRALRTIGEERDRADRAVERGVAARREAAELETRGGRGTRGRARGGGAA